MAMSGLELALDLSRSAFSIHHRSFRDSYKYSPKPLGSKLTNYDVGLQYIPGELGGYQAVLKKDNPQYSSVAAFALSSSESERSQSRSSDTSGISSMTSGSYVDMPHLKLRYQHQYIKPIIYNSRNILDLGANIRGCTTFVTTPATFEAPDKRIYGEIISQERSTTTNCANDAIVCPECGFEIPREFLPKGDTYKCL